MNEKASPRTVGILFCIAGVFFLVGVIPDLFRPDPFRGATLQYSQGTIHTIYPGRLSRFPRTIAGEFYQYAFFDDKGEQHQGQVFRRQITGREYAIGQRIDVEYRTDRPSVNRQYGETSPNLVVIQSLAALFSVGIVIGVIMIITGRDFISDWKKTRQR